MPPLRRSRCHLAVIALVSLVSSLGSCSWEFHDRVAHAHDKRPIYADAALASAAFVGAVVAVARIVEGTNNCVNDLQGGAGAIGDPICILGGTIAAELVGTSLLAVGAVFTASALHGRSSYQPL